MHLNNGCRRLDLTNNNNWRKGHCNWVAEALSFSECRHLAKISLVMALYNISLNAAIWQIPYILRVREWYSEQRAGVSWAA